MQEEPAAGASFGAEAVSASLPDQSSADRAGCGRERHGDPTNGSQEQGRPHAGQVRDEAFYLSVKPRWDVFVASCRSATAL